MVSPWMEAGNVLETARRLKDERDSLHSLSRLIPEWVSV